MTLTITQESPLTPDATALIDGSQADLRAVYSAEECFSFTAQALDEPGNQFFVARLAGTAVGCVALCHRDGYAEIKRLYVLPENRGSGVARALMDNLENQARRSGRQLIHLETGPKLTAGVALYRAMGYVECSAFGGYSAHPASLFMQKTLQSK